MSNFSYTKFKYITFCLLIIIKTFSIWNKHYDFICYDLLNVFKFRGFFSHILDKKLQKLQYIMEQ